jgi:anti-sigma B factor antagonist
MRERSERACPAYTDLYGDNHVSPEMAELRMESMSEPRQGALDVDERADERSVTLELGGELDISTAERLQQAVARLCVADGPRELVVDLRRLTFVDSSGLAAMVYTNKLCERHGCRLSVIRGSQAVHNVFELTGLDELLPFAGDATGPTPI